MVEGPTTKPPDLDAIRARAEIVVAITEHGRYIREVEARAILREWDALLAEVERLREALARVRLVCLLNVRRAAFAPTIGVRYTETIRADIADECARLEQLIDAALAAQESAE